MSSHSGTKLDLRDNPETLRQLAADGKQPIMKSHAQKTANKIRAVRYLECSALTQQGLKQVIFTLERVALIVYFSSNYHLDRNIICLSIMNASERPFVFTARVTLNRLNGVRSKRIAFFFFSFTK